MNDAGLRLNGFHHLTAVTARASANHAFYTGVMGLRLVKKTVNQDDVSAYHLYYADGLGSPGTDITFFDWPVGPERRGGRSVARTSFRLGSTASLLWWQARFDALGVRHAPIAERDHRAVLDFEDPEGQRLGLVVNLGEAPGNPWIRSPVPAEHQVLGLGPVRMSVADIRPTERLLTGVLNMEAARTYHETDGGKRDVHVFTMAGHGAAAELHVAVEPGLGPARPGAGGVHHLALRTPNAEEYSAWEERLLSSGIPSSGPVDRFYFQSLYFREPGGVLFEIATDGPGFATDEPLDALGETLALPPFLEGRRKEIEANLAPIAS